MRPNTNNHNNLMHRLSTTRFSARLMLSLSLLLPRDAIRWEKGASIKIIFPLPTTNNLTFILQTQGSTLRKWGGHLRTDFRRVRVLEHEAPRTTGRRRVNLVFPYASDGRCSLHFLGERRRASKDCCIIWELGRIQGTRTVMLVVTTS